MRWCRSSDTLPAWLDTVFTHYLNSLAFRAQGFESEVQYQPLHNLFVRGGYTYLNAVVLRSFSTDAYNNGAFGNPNLPGIPIGAEGPLVGARPFRRPPHTGFFAAQYTASKFSAAFKGAFASRADDSTFLDGFDVNFGNTLLLPNRNLDFGYAKLDLGGTYVLTHHVTVFTQLDNLLSQHHIGPIGYPVAAVHLSHGPEDKNRRRIARSSNPYSSHKKLMAHRSASWLGGLSNLGHGYFPWTLLRLTEGKGFRNDLDSEMSLSFTNCICGHVAGSGRCSAGRCNAYPTLVSVEAKTQVTPAVSSITLKLDNKETPLSSIKRVVSRRSSGGSPD